jgi:hypothetical protein
MALHLLNVSPRGLKSDSVSALPKGLGGGLRPRRLYPPAFRHFSRETNYELYRTTIKQMA